MLEYLWWNGKSQWAQTLRLVSVMHSDSVMLQSRSVATFSSFLYFYPFFFCSLSHCFLRHLSSFFPPLFLSLKHKGCLKPCKQKLYLFVFSPHLSPHLISFAQITRIASLKFFVLLSTLLTKRYIPPVQCKHIRTSLKSSILSVIIRVSHAQLEILPSRKRRLCSALVINFLQFAHCCCRNSIVAGFTLNGTSCTLLINDIYSEN